MNYDLQTWRLLLSLPASGAWNMAVDETLFESMGKGESLPLLRLYAWEPVCLSLGYAQPAADVDGERLRAHGWDWVRRPTGGRAILHTDELTYSVIAPLTNPRVAGGVLESYQRLSSALLSSLRLLGIQAELHPSAAGSNRGSPEAVCFEVPSNYEIVFGGKKVIGSAQARRKDALLQHGTLPLYGDLTRITQALVYPSEAARRQAAQRLLEHATTVETILGKQVEFSAAAEAFTSAFQSELNLELIQGDLSTHESQRALELVNGKYAHPSWMGRI